VDPRASLSPANRMPIAFFRRRSHVGRAAALATRAGLSSPLLLCALTGALTTSCGAGMDATPGPESGSESANLVGNPAPDFHVQALSGGHGDVSLKELRGNVVVLDFWGTYCGPCKHSFPKLQELHASYGSLGLHIVGISEDEADDKGKIATFVSAYGAKFTIGWDEDKAVAHRYRPDVMPSTYVIDKKGIVRFVHVGFRDGDEVAMRREVQTLLAQ